MSGNWGYGHAERRHVDSVVRRIDQLERSQTTRGRGRPRKTIREVIKKYIEINDLDRNIVPNRTLTKVNPCSRSHLVG